MRYRTLVLLTAMILVLGCLIATAAEHHWWRKSATEIGDRELPSASVEYARIMACYQRSDFAVDLSGTIRIYDGERNNELRETRTFRGYSYMGHYFWQLSYLQTFCDGNLILQLDTVDRVINVSRAFGADGIKRALAGMQPGLLFSDTGAFQLNGVVEESGSYRELILHSGVQPQMRECRIFYDPAGYRLRKAEIELWKGGRNGKPDGSGKVWLVKLDYDDMRQPRPDIAGAMASMVIVSNGLVKATPRFQSYKLNVNF